MARRLEKFRGAAQAHALALLVFCIGAQLFIYWMMIVSPTPLAQLYQRPRVDLLAILRVEPLAWLRLLTAFVLLGALYFVGWWALGVLSRTRQSKGWTWVLVLSGALAAAALLLALYPFDAADIFDNISHGRILGVYGANPYLSVSADFPNDPFALYPAWPRTVSAYGPLWEYMAALVARLAGDGIVANVLAFKLLPGFFYAAAVGLAPLILRVSAPRRMLGAAWLIAWNPLVLVETFGHGHNDMLIVAFLMAAAWAVSRRYHILAFVLLVLGGLVKFIPLLLIPLAGILALIELPTLKSRLRYLVSAGVLAVVLVVITYAPVWTGPEILTVERRARLFTTSLPSILFSLSSGQFGAVRAAELISQASALATLAFALVRADLAGRELQRVGTGRLVQVFSRSAVQILIFYLFFTVLWFHQWYLLWPVGLAALLPRSRTWMIALLSGFAVMTKPLLIGPLVFYWLPKILQPVQELGLSLGVLALPWSIILWALYNMRWRIGGLIQKAFARRPGYIRRN